MKRESELNKRLMCECRCDERLKVRTEGSTCLGYTGLCEGLEHLKIETRLINKRFVSVMGECALDVTGDPSIFKIIRSDVALRKDISTFRFQLGGDRRSAVVELAQLDCGS
jgi:hypothetical protein